MTASTLATPRLPPAASVALAAWLGLVLLGGATGFFAGLPFPGTQVIILGLVVATIVAGFAVPALRAWIDGLPLRALISINVFRMVGFVFLAYAARGQLAQVFADRAGWGDIAVGALALGLVAAGEPRTALHRGLTYAWNALGTLDLVTALVTATFVTIRGVTPGVQALLTLPLVVIPAFLVPIYFAAHVLIFRRLVSGNVR